MSFSKTKLLRRTIAVAAAALIANAQATVVHFKTNVGDFDVNLFDSSTPETVENFLSYVEAGSFDNTIIHRSVTDFVAQGGGFNYFSEDNTVDAVPAFDPVINEPIFSNVRGTIAMAKLGGDPNSATNQWFVNMGDNSANLDLQNGGFTVFGIVMGDGMEVIDAINALDRYNLGGAFDSAPLISVPEDGGEITNEHLVIVESITVTDNNVDTNLELLPPLTIDADHDGYPNDVDAFPEDDTEWLDTDSDGTGNNADSDDDNDGVADANDDFPLDPSRSERESNDSSGGGSLSLWALIALGLTSRLRRTVNK
ncbi:peptidylprolyl isomerase [Thalassotalea litorea]|uniref:peptidylprolyl isomerase n=1 Tax=Thalassotalea litorea TaxID=2020715 RepID=A0A5R9IMY3_9GAMM|nr:peptidylprolyl isomerase [Thalassotalea litorea]TLU64596.1 peptidylprolyl isomerase [Thalassotalea litorea]